MMLAEICNGMPPTYLHEAVMNFSNAQPPQINLSRRRFEEPFFVDMESFFEFSFWMSEELLDLEATHRNAAKRRSDATQVPEHVLDRSKTIV
jgi:hypothetical protein